MRQPLFISPDVPKHIGENEMLARDDHGVCQVIYFASLREGGGPRSGGRSKRMQKHHFACGGIRFFPFSVEAEVFSSHGALSFRHPCGAGRWGEATAPCSHPGGSHSENRTACGYGIRPYGNRVCYPHRPNHRKCGKQLILGRGGAMPFATNGIAPPNNRSEQTPAVRLQRTITVDGTPISACNC